MAEKPKVKEKNNVILNMTDHLKNLKEIEKYYYENRDGVEYRKIRAAILAVENMQAYIKKLCRLAKRFT